VFDLDSLPSLKNTIDAHGLRATKALGQNFLTDQNITDKIARNIAQIQDKHIVEIGAGPGGLTRSLLRAGAKKVTAIEFDPRAIVILQELQKACPDRLHLIHGDALKYDLFDLFEGSPISIVANLPYNIATPLLMGWLKTIHDHPTQIEQMVLMFQKEVAERITAMPHTGDYGRLSVMAQSFCTTHRVMDLNPACFVPAPKIWSSVVSFHPNAPESYVDFTKLESLVKQAFSQRRKMIRSNLKDYLPVLEFLGIDPNLRAENINVLEYKRIVEYLNQ
jgi:16S rRNA (adenine1518-N6/adenine1519-N6)-dimethyltransferase